MYEENFKNSTKFELSNAFVEIFWEHFKENWSDVLRQKNEGMPS